jgi:hypothetical protein
MHYPSETHPRRQLLDKGLSIIPDRRKGLGLPFRDDTQNDLWHLLPNFSIQAGFGSQADHNFNARIFMLPLLYGFFSKPYPIPRRIPEDLFFLLTITLR